MAFSRSKASSLTQMEMQLIPITTRILTPNDDLIGVLQEYIVTGLQPGDVVAISSKVVAIIQGRVLRPDDIRPGFLAHTISRFICQDGSMSSPYSLQAVMDEEGMVRVAAAFVIGALSRILLRRKGDFYRLAGEQAKVTDDVSGTMPPFDKHIVMGPKHPDRVVEQIKKAISAENFIVDSNDLGRADILAATPGVDREAMLRIFRENPWGNADQQTPLMIIRPVTKRKSKQTCKPSSVVGDHLSRTHVAMSL